MTDTRSPGKPRLVSAMRAYTLLCRDSVALVLPAMASTAIDPMLCRVAAYSGPGFPRPTISQGSDMSVAARRVSSASGASALFRGCLVAARSWRSLACVAVAVRCGLRRLRGLGGLACGFAGSGGCGHLCGLGLDVSNRVIDGL